jgi:hypothetical protein
MCGNSTEKLLILQGKIAERKRRKTDGRWLWSGSHEHFLMRRIRTDGTTCYSGRYQRMNFLVSTEAVCRKAAVNRSGNTGLYARLLLEDGRSLYDNIIQRTPRMRSLRIGNLLLCNTARARRVRKRTLI